MTTQITYITRQNISGSVYVSAGASAYVSDAVAQQLIHDGLAVPYGTPLPGLGNLVTQFQTLQAFYAANNAGLLPDSIYQVGGVTITKHGTTLTGHGNYIGLDYTSFALPPGQYTDGSSSYISNGVQLAKRQHVGRHRMLVIGNSIPGYSQVGLRATDNYATYANGPLRWLHAFSLDGFDFVRTVSPTFPTVDSHTGALDRFGIYSCSGGWSKHILNDINQIIDSCLETPTIVRLANIFENNIGNDTLANMIADADKLVKAVNARLPNALIIFDQPNPSANYTSGSIGDFVSIKAYVATLPASYNNVITVNNNSTITNTFRPITGLTVDGIHPNERGAFVRGRSDNLEIGWLFTPRDVAEHAYVAASDTGAYIVNPTFNLLDTVATRSSGNAFSDGTYTGNALPGWQQHKNTGWGDGTANQTVSQNPTGGIDITIQRNGAVSTEQVFDTFNSWQDVPVIANGDVGSEFTLSTRIKIINPTNLFGFSTTLNLWNSGNSSNVGIYAAMVFQNTFYAAHPEGLSDLFQAGDEFVFVTPPIPAPVAGVHVYQQLQPMVVQTVPTGAITIANPSFTLKKSNVIRTKKNGRPIESITPPSSGAAYTNQKTYPHDVVISGGTVSSIAFMRGNVSTALGVTSGVFRLEPGDSIVPTYSVTPTMLAIPRL